MYERFTDRARKVMQLANQEAQRFNHEYIGTEHMLAGLLLDRTSVAAMVLEGLHVDIDDLRQRIDGLVQPGKPSRSTPKELPYTSRAKKVLELAIAEARALGQPPTGSEHLLAGLLLEDKGLAAQLLTYVGVTIEPLRAEIVRVRAAQPAVPGRRLPGSEISSVSITLRYVDGSMGSREFRNALDAIAFLAKA